MRFLLFQGTMARGAFWAATIALFFARRATEMIPDPLVDLVVSIPLAWLGMCVIAARLRDAGLSAWLALVFITPLPLVFVNWGLFMLSAFALLAFMVALGIMPRRTSIGDNA